MTKFRLPPLLLFFVATTLFADTNREVLLEFDSPASIRNWRAVNDGVMGGRSVGRYRLTDKNMLEFFGYLSLENNGGFASIRLPSGDFNFKQGDSVILRVKGDGRTYNMNLYAQRNLGGYSFRQSFKTTANKLIEVKLPVDQFVATWRGRVFPKQELNPSQIAGLGILLGDKKQGKFSLQIESISIQRGEKN
ncbi:MAG: CIA30 family protein [Rhodopirellula sp.]|nr:CIA30 family protein [Rhodopirellula sp.]|tara:strand:+ start:613 stop:1188 length:576 start_codon:yes stop_codon:yes gene_type:complete